MNPEAMRKCMSFGFSDKKSKSAIGKCMEFCNHLVISTFLASSSLLHLLVHL